MSGRLVYDGKSITVKIKKRAHSPILRSVPKLKVPVKIPWLNNTRLNIEWGLPDFLGVIMTF